MEKPKISAAQGMCSLCVTGAWGEQRPGELEHGLNECKTALKNVSLPSHSTEKLPLTFHFFYLHLPGYALCFKIVKVSLKFHPFLKQDNMAVSREVQSARLLCL